MTTSESPPQNEPTSGADGANGTPAEQQQPPAQAPELRTYRGNCHCAAFVYEVRLPALRAALECACGLCHRKGCLWNTAGPEQLSFVRGDRAALARYVVGGGGAGEDAEGRDIVHRFCGKCATLVLAELGEGDGTVLINVRAIQGVNTWTLEKKPYTCPAAGVKCAPATHDGPLPVAMDGHQLYTGSCHCSAVTVAFRSKPLDGTFDGLMIDCNCSICNGYRWVYPSKEQVVLFARDMSKLGRYSFAHHVLNKTFCTACGVCMTHERTTWTDEELRALGAAPTPWYAEMMDTVYPVNLRVFPDVDLAAMKPPKLNDGAEKIKPRYVCP